jgi:ABC-type branched-subunit amino acid transport system substrate-binding protein
MRKSRLVVLGLIAALCVAACGSRTTNLQKVEALRGSGNGEVGSGGDQGSGDLALGGTGGSGTLNGSTASGNTGGVSGGGVGPSGSNTNTNSNAAPSGGNGGATDVGVTATSITVGNVSILTGPVPGLFKGAVNGTDAFFQYQNSVGGVYGRKLTLKPLDDQFDCGVNKSLTEANASKVFAFVGSFSLYDNCGADTFNANPTLPDVHNALSRDAQHQVSNFSSQPLRTGSGTGEFLYFKNKFPDAITASASLVGDVQAARDSWVGIKGVMTSPQLGYKFLYERLYEPTETDFTSDIVQMQAKGVKALILVAADVKSIARIAQAADQQHWHPTFTLLGASAYDPTLLDLAKTQVEGDWLYIPAAMYLGQDRATNKEVDLFLTWLKRTHPGDPVDLFSVYGWESARLFVQALQTAGPKATRTGLIAALKNVHQFDGNGMYPVGDPAGKGPPTCYIIVRVQGGDFTRVDDPPNAFRCDGQYMLIQP